LEEGVIFSAISLHFKSH